MKVSQNEAVTHCAMHFLNLPTRIFEGVPAILSGEYRLKVEGYTAPNRAGGVDEVDRLAVLAEDRNISLS